MLLRLRRSTGSNPFHTFEASCNHVRCQTSHCCCSQSLFIHRNVASLDNDSQRREVHDPLIRSTSTYVSSTKLSSGHCLGYPHGSEICGELRATFSRASIEHFRQLFVNSVGHSWTREANAYLLCQNWDKAFKDASEVGFIDYGRCATNRKATIVIEHLLQASMCRIRCNTGEVYIEWNELFFGWQDLQERPL
jgi:hypothetical protein